MLFLGGGGLIGGIVGILTLFSNHNGSRIEWYDRAIKDNEHLRDEIVELKAELDLKTKENIGLQSKIQKLRNGIVRMKLKNKELTLKVKELITELARYKEEENGNITK